MRKALLALGAASMALAAPVLAQGRGHGQGHDKGKAEAGAERGRGHADSDAGPRRGRGGDARHAERGNDGRQRAERPGRGAGDRGRSAEVRREARPIERGPDLRDRPARSVADARRDGRRGDRARGRVERRAVVLTDRADIVRLRHDPRRAFVRGCPPGLARKHNGCLPPGLARRLAAERPWYANWWRHADDGLYRYNGGYLYNLRPDGIVAGFVPLAGGALWLGNPWPANYAYDPVPDYYVDYYGYDDPYDYRYADGVIYGLDPETAMIRQIAGLVTGDDWSIGQRAPDGYGVYNVPYAYRDEYYDTPDDWYRYSDGYVYRVDPTTQLIEAAIRLIA